jgi:D-alanine transaminase
LTDIRWKYCHIKSTSLLPSVLLYHEVFARGCHEGILIREGFAIEGISSNLFIVQDGVVITPPVTCDNLSGVTRDLILNLLRENNISYREESIAKEQLFLADEIWISSSTRGIFPIVQLDEKIISNGVAGPIWEKVVKLYLEYRDNV